jgi:hypothetical protein
LSFWPPIETMAITTRREQSGTRSPSSPLLSKVQSGFEVTFGTLRVWRRLGVLGRQERLLGAVGAGCIGRQRQCDRAKCAPLEVRSLRLRCGGGDAGAACLRCAVKGSESSKRKRNQDSAGRPAVKRRAAAWRRESLLRSSHLPPVACAPVIWLYKAKLLGTSMQVEMAQICAPVAGMADIGCSDCMISISSLSLRLDAVFWG